MRMIDMFQYPKDAYKLEIFINSTHESMLCLGGRVS